MKSLSSSPEILRLIRLRPGQPQIEIGRSDTRRYDRHSGRKAPMRLEPHRLAQRRGVRGKRPMNVEIENVVAGVALDVVDFDMHLRAVANVEEAWQRRR